MTGRSALLVVEHERDCPPGRLADAAGTAWVDLEVLRPWAGETLPANLDGAAGLVVLGGSMGVGDAATWPHLYDTMALIRHAAARAAPVLGICLGAQLAAQALGGRAFPAPAGVEVGWAGVGLTPAGRDDPVLGAVDQTAEMFHWHQDTFDPPRDAAVLAFGRRYHQAFRLGSVLAVQFHPEVDEAIVERWYATVDPPPPYPIADALAGVARSAPKPLQLLETFCHRVAAGATPTEARSDPRSQRLLFLGVKSEGPTGPPRQPQGPTT
jgi:GMP synthase (glutamine-hydrolysing)